MAGWNSSRYDAMTPADPAPASEVRDFAFQALTVCALALGARYLAWRWTESLNPDALAFSIVIAAAETLAYVGAVLFALSIWRVQDPVARPPPRTLNDVLDRPRGDDRPLKVDVLVTTLDEPVDLVRDAVRSALRIRYPHPITLRVHLLDDGGRPEMRRMAEEEGAAYLSRETNEGFKAGNLRNGLEHSDGDLVVVCDADTWLLPSFLEETLGYFRDPRVAWVQTPQWFCDVDPGVRLPEWLASRARLGGLGRLAGRAVEAAIGPVSIGADRLGTDPRAFYDVVQRGRNWCNASFCCGAGSVHRREAVMDGALRDLGVSIAAAVRPLADRVEDPALRRALSTAVAGQVARREGLTPYRFHVSEDVATSIRLHADGRRWRSVYHPRAVTCMLSPQDLVAWSIQRFRYASGTLDLALHERPLFRRGLSGWQRLMYGATMYAYLAPLWIVPLLLAPLVFFFTGATPVRAFDLDFFVRLVPFLVASRLALLAGTWGTPTWRGEQYQLAAFWLNLRALAHVLLRRPLRFPVTPKVKVAQRALRLAVPHLVLLAAMAAGVAWGAVRVQGSTETTAYVTNVFWTLHNAACLLPFVLAAAAPRRLGVAP